MFILDNEELIDVARAVAKAREAYQKEMAEKFGDSEMFPIDITVRVMLNHDVEGDPRRKVAVEVLHYYETEEGYVTDRW